MYIYIYIYIDTHLYKHVHRCICTNVHTYLSSGTLASSIAARFTVRTALMRKLSSSAGFTESQGADSNLNGEFDVESPGLGFITQNFKEYPISPDGRCFFHCLVAAENWPEYLQKPRHANGVAVSLHQQQQELEAAKMASLPLLASFRGAARWLDASSLIMGSYSPDLSDGEQYCYRRGVSIRLRVRKVALIGGASCSQSNPDSQI